MYAQGYENSRAYFEQVRSAVLENKRISNILEDLEVKAGVKAQSYTERITIGSQKDATKTIDKRLLFQEKTQELVDANNRLIQEAIDLIYGEAGSGGAYNLISGVYLIAVHLRYIEGLSWSETSKEMHTSKRSCMRYCDAAFDTMDFFGINSLISGMGKAT